MLVNFLIKNIWTKEVMIIWDPSSKHFYHFLTFPYESCIGWLFVRPLIGSLCNFVSLRPLSSFLFYTSMFILSCIMHIWFLSLLHSTRDPFSVRFPLQRRRDFLFLGLIGCFFLYGISVKNVSEYRNLKKFILIWDLIKSKFLISAKVNSEIPNSIKKIFYLLFVVNLKILNSD